VFDLRPKGQDGLQGPVDTDGEAGYPRHHPHERTAVPAGAPGHDLADAVNARVIALQREVTDADDKLKRLYRLVEDGMTEMDDVLKDRLNSLKADRDCAKAALERAKSHSSQAIQIDPALLEEFGRSMRECARHRSGERREQSRRLQDRRRRGSLGLGCARGASSAAHRS
jgi:hypothetical protein